MIKVSWSSGWGRGRHRHVFNRTANICLIVLIVLRLLLALPFTWNYLGVPGVNLSTSPASPTAPSAAPASASSSVGLTTGSSETLTKTLGEISPVVCQSFTRPFWFVPTSFGSTSASLLRLLHYCRFRLITKERYWIH